MRLTILVVVAFLSGCSGKRGPAAAGVTPGGGSSLTVSQLEDAESDLQPFDLWDVTLVELTKKLGKPEKVDGGLYIWSAKYRAACQVLTVRKQGDLVAEKYLEVKDCP